MWTLLGILFLVLAMTAVVAINVRYFTFYRAEQRDDSIREANDLINDLNFKEVQSKFLNLREKTSKYMDDRAAFNDRRKGIEEEINVQKAVVGDISTEAEALYDIVVNSETETTNLLDISRKGKETADLLVQNQEKVAEKVEAAESYVSAFKTDVKKFAHEITGVP